MTRDHAPLLRALPAPDERAAIPSAGRWAAAVIAAAGVLIGLTAFVAAFGPYELAFYTRDAAEAVNREGGCDDSGCGLAGLQSTIGMLVLWGAAVLTLAVAVGIWRQESPWGAALGLWGLLTALLAFDDIFQLHENVLPEVLPGGEREVLALYAVVGILFLLKVRRVLPRTDAWVFAAAVACFAVSVLSDQVIEDVHLLEDGVKLVGIGLWALFVVGTSIAVVRLRFVARDG